MVVMMSGILGVKQLSQDVTGKKLKQMTRAKSILFFSCKDETQFNLHQTEVSLSPKIMDIYIYVI